jgi:hypothetical protein
MHSDRSLPPFRKCLLNLKFHLKTARRKDSRVSTDETNISGRSDKSDSAYWFELEMQLILTASASKGILKKTDIKKVDGRPATNLEVETRRAGAEIAARVRRKTASGWIDIRGRAFNAPVSGTSWASSFSPGKCWDNIFINPGPHLY